MKKQQNKTLRIASVLLVLALATTVALTGTLARYTASAAVGSQTVRVAAWDIEISFDNSTWVKLKNVNAADFLLLGKYGTSVYTHGLTAADEDATTAGVWDQLETSQLIKPAYNNGITPDFLVHPGIGGYINFWIRNNSEVPADVTIDLGDATVADELDVIKILLDGSATAAPMTGALMSTATFTGDLTDLATAAIAPVRIAPSATPVPTLVSFAWKWDYAKNDTVPVPCTETDPDEPCADSDGLCPTHDGFALGDYDPTIDAADTKLGEDAVATAFAAILKDAKISVTQVD